MNMPKCEFKLGHNASESSTNNNRSWGERSICYQTVRRWFQKICSGDENLEDKEGRGRSCSLDNEKMQAVVVQNHCQNVREMSQTLGITTATVSRYLHSTNGSLVAE